MTYYPHVFEGTIVHHNVGTYTYTVVFLPPELHDKLPLDKYPRLRINAEIAEFPVDGAWQPVRGRWYLMLSRRLMKDGELSIGDEVEVRFRVADQNAVDIPDELQLALDENNKAAAAWEKLTAGKKRGFTYRVASARTVATRDKRVAEVVETLIAL